MNSLQVLVHPEVVGETGAGCVEKTGPAGREHGEAAVDDRAPSGEPATPCWGAPTTSGCTLRVPATKISIHKGGGWAAKSRP